MVKFKLKANPSGQYYFPKEVREELGNEIELICNAKAGVVYSAKTPLEIVLKSLEVIEKDLRNRLELQKSNI
jgi:bifunctional DNA-binding transcriptional regulator/antitoxin component of YhaV-PrlF toxin-antitoxin module